MVAHEFNSEIEALQAIQLINDGEGIPVSPEAVTRTYTKAFEYSGKWYVQTDEITLKYIKEFVHLNINTDM